MGRGKLETNNMTSDNVKMGEKLTGRNSESEDFIRKK